MSLIGRPTIQPVLFFTAKLALVPPHAFLALAVLHTQQGRLAFPRLAPVGWALVVFGLAVAGRAIANLGDSVRVGLPEGETRFRVEGLYRFSRNPIYTGLFLSMLGSCVLVPHVANLASAATAMVLHHAIVLGEERFLDGRFGDEWRVYRARVRRYL